MGRARRGARRWRDWCQHRVVASAAMTNLVSISNKEARQLAGRALFGADLSPELSDTEKAILAEDFGPKLKAVVHADGTITRGTAEVFEKPCPPAKVDELERALGHRA